MKRKLRPTSHKKPLLHKEVSIQCRRKPRYSCEIHVPNRILSNSRQNPRHANARGRDESLGLPSILWSDWRTSKQRVLLHGNRFVAHMFAGVIFRRERSDDRKYVCGSQAIQDAMLNSLLFQFFPETVSNQGLFIRILKKERKKKTGRQSRGLQYCQ